MKVTTINTALLILNGNSRNGANADIQEGLQLLKNANINIIQKSSGSANETAQLIQDYCDQIQLVILGGGDGTISSATEAHVVSSPSQTARKAISSPSASASQQCAHGIQVATTRGIA